MCESEKALKVQDQRKGSDGSFLKELQELINKHSMEKGSDTPDFILAMYLYNCLTNYDLTQQQKSDWYG